MRLKQNINTYRYILKLALPAIAGLSTQMVVSLVDAAMVGRTPDAKIALAAMGIGVMATWALISFFSSLATGTHVITARRFGEKKFIECGYSLTTSMIIAIVMGTFVSLLGVLFAYEISDFMTKSEEVGIFAGDYLFYRFMGIPFFLLTVTFRGFFFGIGKPKVFMYSGVLANVNNIIFNYIFIFGAFGIEPMGLSGAGLGSTLATIGDVVFYMIVLSQKEYTTTYRHFENFKYIKKVAKSIINISLPVSFQNVFILIGFLTFIALNERVGTLEASASTLVINSLFISIMPCFGFGIAVHTLVGNALGERKVSLARFYGAKTAVLATIFTTMIGIFFISFPRLVLRMLTDQSEVIEAAVTILRIAGFGQIVYGIGIVLANGLQAAGKTFFVMIVEVLSNIFLFLPAAYILGFVFDFGAIGIWSALPIYIFVYTVSIYIKFKYGDWKKLKSV